jgi:hypothetical protein
MVIKITYRVIKTFSAKCGRGVATFSMNFSASANTKANFDADGEGSMQNMFSGENTPYYYGK